MDPLSVSISDVARSYWVHDLSPFLIQFSDQLGLRYYSLAYIVGLAVAWFLLRYYERAGRSPLTLKDCEGLFFALFLGVVLGGRLGYVLFYDFANFVRAPWILFYVWEGGMASHGGFIGVTLATLYAARHLKISALRLGDLIVTVAPPGLFLGRVANFINGELWGKPTEVAWAVIFPQAPFNSNAPAVFVESLGMWANPRHPSQLYAAFLEGLVLTIYLQVRFWNSGKKLPAGQLAAEFFVVYAIMRIIGEIFREPDAPLLLGLSRGTLYSLVTLLAGAVLLYAVRRHPARSA